MSTLGRVGENTMNNRRIVAIVLASAVTLAAALAIAASSGPAAAASSGAPSAGDIQAGLDKAGPIQGRFGFRMLSTSALMRKCWSNFGSQGHPEACAPLWPQAGQIATEMSDAINALPDPGRYDRVGEQLRQVGFAADRFAGFSCSSSEPTQQDRCEQARTQLVIAWDEAGVQLELVEPTRPS